MKIESQPGITVGGEIQKMIRGRGGSCTNIHLTYIDRRMQSRATSPRHKLPQEPVVQSCSPHSTRRRQCSRTKHTYIHTAAAANPLRELSTPPSSAFLPLPAVRISSCFSKVTNVKRIRSRRRMIKPRREPLVGTGTGFCFRPEKAPHLQEHHTVHGHGRKDVVSGG